MTRFDPAATISLPVAGPVIGPIAGPVPDGSGKGWMFRLSQTLGLRDQRRRLAVLDDAALRDIGLTRDAAVTEAARPLWDVPANWLR